MNIRVVLHRLLLILIFKLKSFEQKTTSDPSVHFFGNEQNGYGF
jgi:hypothetical protein